MPKPRYKTTNWKQYNKALINRGSLTFWIDEEAIRQWKQSKQDKRGRPRQFSDLAITTALMVKRVFSMPLRALQGFIDSVFSLANVPIVCPHYSCISRRAKQVEVSFKPKTRGAIQHLAIDATGLKVYGEGEWKVKKHGTDGEHRVWRKLHLAVDTSTHEVVAAERVYLMLPMQKSFLTCSRKHTEELSRYLVMALMTKGIATMPYGSSELFHSSLLEKGQPSGRMVTLGI